VGDEGVATTILRPSGKALFGSAFADVVTDGEFLEPGARVVVTRVSSGTLFVEPAHRGADSAEAN